MARAAIHCACAALDAGSRVNVTIDFVETALRIREEISLNRTANVRGGEGSNIPLDLVWVILQCPGRSSSGRCFLP